MFLFSPFLYFAFSIFQNDGRGIVPLSFTASSEPSTPSLHVASLSASQLAISVTPPTSTGGLPITGYLLEYTTNTTFGGKGVTTQIRLSNPSSNDTTGYFRLDLQDSSTSLLPWGASALELQNAINDLAYTQDAVVTRTDLPYSAIAGRGYEYTIRATTEVLRTTLTHILIMSTLLEPYFTLHTT